MNKSILPILFLLLQGFLLGGQSAHFSCGHDAAAEGIFYEKNIQRLLAERLLKKGDPAKMLTNDTLEVRVKLWMIRLDNGTGLGSSAMIYQNLDTANLYFLQGNIRFEICEEVNVNSSLYHDLDVDTELAGLQNTYYTPGRINLYITNSVTFNGSPVGGVGYAIGFGSDLTAINYQAATASDGYALLAHELGHCLHLWHTHGKFNTDPSGCIPANNNTGLNDNVWCQGAVNLDNNPAIDNNNDQVPDCLQSGDDVCDTHAEPQLGLPGMVTNCQYTGTVTDPNGALYDPLLRNFMSYGPTCPNDLYFSQGQYDRMRTAVEHFGLHLFCNACANGSQPTTKTVTTLEDFKVGSLRWAITCANNSPGPDTIRFGNGLDTNIVQLTSELPALKGHITLEGGNANFEKMTLDGSALTDPFASGITLDGDSMTVKNISIKNMPLRGILGLSGSSHILVDSCTVAGSGRLFPDFGFGVLFLEQGHHITVQHTVLSNNDGAGAYFEADTILFQNNTVSANDDNGLNLIQSKNATLSGNTIFNNASNGIFVWDSSDNALISNNTIHGNASSGIAVFASQNTSIIANTLDTNAFYGVSLWSNAANTLVEGNEMQANNASGMIVFESHQTTIRGNAISGNVNYGVDVRNGSSNTIVENNQIMGNAFSGAIVIGSPNTSLLNNTLDSNAFYGVDIRDGATNTLVQGNQLNGNNFSGGIVIASANTSFIGNTLNGNTFYGLDVRGGSSGTTVQGNLLSANGFSGAAVIASQNTNLTGNTLSNNTFYGVEIRDGSSLSVLQANLVSGNQVSGAIVIGSDTTSLLNNTISGNVQNGAMLINNSTEAFISGNVIGANGQTGILVDDCTNVGITGNKIGVNADLTPNPNGSNGIALVNNAAQVTIGGLTLASENHIANHPSTGIGLFSNANNCTFERNKIYCNSFNIFLQPGTNGNIADPTVTSITAANQISGTCPANALVRVFRSKADCTDCGSFEYLGAVTASGTTWQLAPATPLGNGDKLTATATLGNNTSAFAACQTFAFTCTPNLVVNSVPVPTGSYHSTGDLVSFGSVIPTGGAVAFQSDSGILLQGVFTVELGAVFDAVIQPCTAPVVGGEIGGKY